jgi:hypothetical protein
VRIWAPRVGRSTQITSKGWAIWVRLRSRGPTCGIILRRYGYPPDKQEQAIQTLLQQTEMLWDS